jgi:hypothetical protein
MSIIMDIKIFIGFRSFGVEECNYLKRITHEGKEFVGVFAEKTSLSLKEIEQIALKIGSDFDHVTVLPVLLFG